ncbi:anthranilate synthase component II [Corynebacterium pelargi]|uniref:anthranilate synthase n=1 Tax=Corynebacterium pelargi TaxID=1471400 RepID=A0A410WBW2_9CORY|nr:anthranilate synthase component II [Corynebacterium pelargi]QAU53439.1 Anthranilate synthase component 2 [Corynebacterium pelargi]GGG82016.1 anthranilate synthase component 2 [Corynebacterium pelargi]
MRPEDIHVLMLDNRDSFVYNLVDAFAVAGYRCTVFRNDVAVEEILAAQPDLIVLSPGPGHPREAGCMMELISACFDQHIPMLGICLGFQALLEHFGGTVRPCGPVHGTMDHMKLSPAGMQSPLFAGLATDAGPENHFKGSLVPIARYHSLGCTDSPEALEVLATCESEIGEVVMAASTPGAIGLQFHPESVLSPAGPKMIDRCIEALLVARDATSKS